MRPTARPYAGSDLMAYFVTFSITHPDLGQNEEEGKRAGRKRKATSLNILFTISSNVLLKNRDVIYFLDSSLSLVVGLTSSKVPL